MKTRLCLAFALLVLVALTTKAVAQTASEKPVELNDLVREAIADAHVVRGDTSQKVFLVLGEPDVKPLASVWIYFNFETPKKAALDKLGYNTLVVAFVGDRVTRIRFISRASAELLVARVKASKPATAATDEGS